MLKSEVHGTIFPTSCSLMSCFLMFAQDDENSADQYLVGLCLFGVGGGGL